MPEKVAPIKKPEPEVEPLVLSLETEADLAAGEKVVLPCGLGVVLAPSNTQAANKAITAAVKRYGGRRAQSINDLSGQKRIDAMIWAAVRSTFLGFFDPKTDKPEFAVREPGSDDLRSFKGNTEANRIALMADYPALRDQISDEIDRLTEEVGEVEESTSGN